ncbi:MAG: lipocalin family protein [Myxococcota bacterium]
MDKEFGSSLLGDNQVGWDWFSLQLDDGEELMLYVLRNPDGAVDHASGTRVLADGSVQYFDQRAWTIDVEERWQSESGGHYPVAWTVRVAGRTLRIRAHFFDQENRGTLISDLAYWEGAVEILDDQGARLGQGFVEMTGYGE